MVVLKPNIVRGGRAIGLGNNFYLMKGRTHTKGGIDIGKNPKTGLEVENNEVMQVSPKGVRVFSAQPILGGISPAQYILGGANPNQVFNAQEQWKKINRINDDGTRKAEWGKKIYKKTHNVSLIDDIPEYQAPLNYDEIKRRQEFMESEFNSKAYNKNSGAKGRFQIRENALQDYIRAGGEEGDLFDSDYNEKVRDWIMEDLSKSSMIIAGNPTDSVKMAKQLAAYNWGRGNLSKFLQRQKAAGIDIYTDIGWIDSLPKETKDYVNFSLRNQDINDVKNNERYNSLIKKYGGRQKVQYGTKRSRKKMFSNVTKRIKQIAEQEENRNKPLPIRGEKPITPLGYDVASYTPIVGDAIQLGEGISDIKNRNYLAGAINLGLLAIPNAIQGHIKKGIQSAVRKYEIKHLPGYQLKSLMEGNPLEKQLSKDGTISVNSIKAISNKGSEVEKSVINKVLDTKYAGKKSIDYNDFRKSVQDELIVYDRTLNTKYSDYGLSRLFPDPAGGTAGWYGIATPQTFTFSSDRIPIGNARHYDANTLGHSRTYITNDEPNILHVMESQSDWAQHGKIGEPYGGTTSYLNDPESYRQFINRHKKLLEEMKLHPEDYMEGAIEKQENNIKRHETVLQNILKGNNKNSQLKYLRENFTTRQIQENLRYAAERGQKKMRYPTRETAAKIEDYPVVVKKELDEHTKYSPKHESILKKYSDFPKQYKKLYKDANVRTIIDKMGNSWYEVDVPQNYLNSEWKFKYGGKRNHKEFGGNMDFNYYITKDNIYKLGGRKKALNGTDYLKLLWEENSNIPKLRFSGLNSDIPEVPTLSYSQRNNKITNNTPVSNPIVKRNDIGLGISDRSQRIVNNTLNNNSRLLESPLQNTIDRGDAIRTVASNQPDIKTNNSLDIGTVSNLIGTGINIAGNLISYGINSRALNKMRRPSIPLPLRAENLQTRVSTAAQEAAIRENVAGQEGLISGNLSSSRSRLNAINRVRNQGTSMYNQLQDRKQNIETELINRNKLNRQQIGNQNVLQFNNWRDRVTEFDNRITDLRSENGVNLTQGIADAIAGERGYLANRENDARYRMNAFLTTIANPDAFNAMNSVEIRKLARQFGITNRQLKDLGINV